MKNKMLKIFFGIVLFLGLVGCTNKTENNNRYELVKETHNKVYDYFTNENVDRTNLGSFSSLGENSDYVIVTLIDNSIEKQQEFLKSANVSEEYIKFEQGGPYSTSREKVDKVDFELIKSNTHNDIKFNEYYYNEIQKIYISSNIKEIYLIDYNKTKYSLKWYASNVNQSLNQTIESITNTMEKKDSLFDGGTIIYKSELKNVTIIVCNTLEGNKDIYIGDYQMNYTDQCGI